MPRTIPDLEADGILYRKNDGVCTITLNKPERLNAIDHGPGSLHRAMTDAVEAADHDDEIRCIVITGAGRAFSSGGYFKTAGGPGEGLYQSASPIDWYGFMRTADDDNERIRDMRKPVIGAINGLCYGAAFMMAVNFDILIAVDTAEFGLLETRFGEPGADVLAYLIGPQWAKFLAFSGDMITAQKAKEIGLILEVFPAETFMDRVNDLARRIASMPPVGVMMNRRTINSAMDVMGWKTQKQMANALNGLLGSVAKDNKSSDGRKFTDLRAASWKEFKAARDTPYTPPWLDR
jgi:enoyl-CoA hydratase/carnithine racemase